nr:uncharacterized protein LOC125993638 isoform X1 [Syngnathus scovelli]
MALRGMLVCAVAVACLPMTWRVQGPQGGRGTPTRIKRMTTALLTKYITINPDIPHADNMWYQYVSMLAKASNQTECYVCSIMPRSSQQPVLHARPIPEKNGWCFALLRAFGFNPLEGLKQSGISDAQLATHPCYNISRPFTIVAKSSVVTPAPVTLEVSKAISHPLCFRRRRVDGIKVGDTKRCITTALLEGTSETSLNTTVAIRQILARGENPHSIIEGGWWLCGRRGYAVLPGRWDGTCAPVYVSDHTVFLSLTHFQEHHERKTRAAVAPTFHPYDSVWGSDVPDEYKLWSTGQKVALTLFPQAGVAKTILRIETMDYRLKSFANFTLEALTGYQTELQALRLMALQSRMVLDLLTAEKGGVCEIVGTSCCTYIPGENDTHIEYALQGLRNLRKAMSQDEAPAKDAHPFWWLFYGDWRQLLLKVAIVLVAILLFLCIFTSCIIPCIRHMMTKMLASAFAVQNIMLVQREQDEWDHLA